MGKEQNVYDVIIVGGGPAGLSAGIYAGRAKLKTLIIEKMAVGGTANLTYEVKNYPGFLDISGMDLMQKMLHQVNDNNVEIAYDNVVKYNLSEEIKEIFCESGTFYAKSVILCNGAVAKKLDLINEQKLTGSGVSYCAMCDGAFFRNKVVCVVGGGNSAAENAIYLSNLAEKVYIICRKDHLKADKTLIDGVKSKKNIEILYKKNVVQINGDNKLESVNIKDENEKVNTLKTDGLFVSIGRVPENNNFPSNLKLSANGYISVNYNMETNIKGVYAAGDIRENALGQIITACADGAIAATHANQYLSIKKEI